MQSTQVKSHKRKGRVVKRHSRAVKGAMKNSGSGMSAEECKAKYDAMVAKYGEKSPQAKKLAMKMESRETVEKDARKKIDATKPSEIKKRQKKTMAGMTMEGKKAYLRAEANAATTRMMKHSRGDYMRKNVEEGLLTKEAKAKKVKHYSGKRKDSGDGPGIKPKSVSMHDKMAALRAKKK